MAESADGLWQACKFQCSRSAGPEPLFGIDASALSLVALCRPLWTTFPGYLVLWWSWRAFFFAAAAEAADAELSGGQACACVRGVPLPPSAA